METQKGTGTWNALVALLAGLYCASYVGADLLGLHGKHQPNTSHVQSGSVVPSKLEIKLQDTDGDGQKETLMQYDGKTYWLKLDKDSKPTIQEYQQPVEKVQKKI